MAAMKPYSRLVALSTSTVVNLMNPGTTTGGVGSSGTPNGNLEIIITHLRIANTTNAAKFAALWKGATGANAAATEFYYAGTATAGALDANSGVSIPANSGIDFYPGAPGNIFVPADFLVGGASATGLTLLIEGFIGIA